MQIFNTIKNLYTKNKELPEEEGVSANIILAKWLSQDVGSLPIIKKTIPFLYYLKSQSYYILLYSLLPHKKPPFIKYNKKKKKSVPTKKIEKAKLKYDWTDREARRAGYWL